MRLAIIQYYAYATDVFKVKPIGDFFSPMPLLPLWHQVCISKAKKYFGFYALQRNAPYTLKIKANKVIQKLQVATFAKSFQLQEARALGNFYKIKTR